MFIFEKHFFHSNGKTSQRFIESVIVFIYGVPPQDF